MYTTGPTRKVSKFAADERPRAVNKLRSYLASQDYVPAELLWSLKVLVPELRGPDDFEQA